MTRADTDGPISSMGTTSNAVSHSSNDSLSATESTSQTIISFNTTLSSVGSCYAAKEYVNDIDACVTRIESQCYRQNQTDDFGRTCKVIVIGESSDVYFIVAIVIGGKKVVVINSKYVIFLLSAIITISVSLWIAAFVIIVKNRKTVAINLQLWYLAFREIRAKSELEQWKMRQHPNMDASLLIS
jgi:hypothetical protein